MFVRVAKLGIFIASLVRTAVPADIERVVNCLIAFWAWPHGATLSLWQNYLIMPLATAHIRCLYLK